MRRGTLFKRGAEDKRGGWAPPPPRGRAGCGVGPLVAECVEGREEEGLPALLAAWVLCGLSRRTLDWRSSITLWPKVGSG